MSITFTFRHIREGRAVRGKREGRGEGGREGEERRREGGREGGRGGEGLLLIFEEDIINIMLLRDRRLHVKKLFTCHANTLNAVSI